MMIITVLYPRRILDDKKSIHNLQCCKTLGSGAHDPYDRYTSKTQSSVSMPACGWEAKRNLEGIVDEPLECRLEEVSQP